MSTNSISLEQLKEQGVILFTRITRKGENGMQLELAVNGSTNELLQAVTELLTQVVVRTAYEDGKLDPVYAMMNAMIVERNFKRALLDCVSQEMESMQGDENAKYQ